MSSNSISFSVTGFSDIIYGAAILTGIYAGVTIMREFFVYKKEELYVKAQLTPPIKFDIAGDIRGYEDNKFVCRECLLRKKSTMDIVCVANTGRQQMQLPIEQAQTVTKVQKSGEKKQVVCGTTAEKPHITTQSPSFMAAGSPNDTLAEVVDLGDNGFHLLEEYGG